MQFGFWGAQICRGYGANIKIHSAAQPNHCPQTLASSTFHGFPVRVFITIITVGPPCLWMLTWRILRADCTMPLYMRDLSIHDSGIHRGSCTHVLWIPRADYIAALPHSYIALPLCIVGVGWVKHVKLKLFCYFSYKIFNGRELGCLDIVRA